MTDRPRAKPSAAEELLRTKLAPPRLHAGLVARGGLLARLEAGLSRKLTLIAAPPGFGKTTLAAAWLAAHHGPVAWLALDAGDNDPVRFWRYIITACRGFDPAVGKAALAMLRSAATPGLETVLTAFLNDLAGLAAPAVLVLDDYQALTAPDVHASVAYLLEHLPETLHLVLLTRSEPPLALARFRARNELNELGAAELRFSLAETQDFLAHTLRAPLAADAVARLEARTEGWVAGLRLVTLALANKTDPAEIAAFIADFSGGHRHVLEYLAGEVLAAQPDALQSFLLQTSFLARLTGALCAAVTGRADSAVVLADLERANLFVLPLGGGERPAWYRYHALFAEAMRHEARQRLGEAAVRELHGRASAWYAAEGLLADAVEAGLAAQQWEPAAALAECVIERQGYRELHTLRRWIGDLPPAVLAAHPALAFALAFAILFASDRYGGDMPALVEGPLRLAEAAWQVAEDEAHLGQVFALRTVVYAWQGELNQSYTAARAAVERLAEGDTYWRGITLLSIGLEQLLEGQVHAAQSLLFEARALCGASQNIYGQLAATDGLGQAAWWQGEFEAARLHFEQVSSEAEGREDMLDDQAAARLGLSTLALEQNDLAEAERLAAEAIDLARVRNYEALEVPAQLVAARVEQARGAVSQAQARLQALAARVQRRWLLREVQASQATLALRAGDLAAVGQWAAALPGQPEPLPLVLNEREQLLVARLRLAQGDTAGLFERLAGWEADAQANGRLRSEIESLTLQALVRQAQGEADAAAETLGQALTLAAGRPGSFLRVFLDEGEALLPILSRARPSLTRRPVAAYAEVLARALAPTRQLSAAAAALLEPLSPQELRVLRLLAAGLSNPEIARELVVSPNTIKTQLKSIYRKLNVTSRADAADAARELRLV